MSLVSRHRALKLQKEKNTVHHLEYILPINVSLILHIFSNIQRVSGRPKSVRESKKMRRRNELSRAAKKSQKFSHLGGIPGRFNSPFLRDCELGFSPVAATTGVRGRLFIGRATRRVERAPALVPLTAQQFLLSFVFRRGTTPSTVHSKKRRTRGGESAAAVGELQACCNTYSGRTHSDSCRINPAVLTPYRHS